MWPFKRKKENPNQQSDMPCSYCGSHNTVVKSYSGREGPDYIKTWRGQRYITCRCLDCKRDYYTNEPFLGLGEEALSPDTPINDEDELRSAEDELKRQIEEEDDRRFKPDGR